MQCLQQRCQALSSPIWIHQQGTPRDGSHFQSYWESSILFCVSSSSRSWQRGKTTSCVTLFLHEQCLQVPFWSYVSSFWTIWDCSQDRSWPYSSKYALSTFIKQENLRCPLLAQAYRSCILWMRHCRISWEPWTSWQETSFAGSKPGVHHRWKEVFCIHQ